MYKGKKYIYINNLNINENAIKLYSNKDGISILQVSRSDFIEHVLIPLFNSLTFNNIYYKFLL